MKLTALAAAFSLVLGSFVLTACDRGPDQGSPSSGSTADKSQSSQPTQPGAPKRSQSKP
jgi:hypothetical protein